MNLSKVAASRPIGTFIIYGVVVLLGVVSLLSLPIDLLPELSFPRLSISTEYPGAGPEEVENLVTRILEEAVGTAVGVEDVISTSSEGNSRIVVTFPFGTDLDAAASDVRASIERARRRLPDAASAPIVFKFDPSQFPIVQLGLVSRSPEVGQIQLRQLADEQILFRLERIPGVAAATILGGLRRQILVEMDPVRLQALAIPERELVAALGAANLTAPGGQVIEGARQLGLRVLSQSQSLSQIARTVVAVRNGVPVYVGDVARVLEGQEEQTSLVRVNGQSGVLFQIQRQSGANTVAVSDRVQREVRTVGPSLQGAELLVLNDSARFIRRSIGSVQQALMLGGILAVGVLTVFLRDWRSVLIIGTAVPVSVIAAFSLMFFFGYTLNLMTLGALTLGIGMLIDASIVVLENIFRHRERGRTGEDAATAATDEVASAIVASTLTTVVVFLPVMFMRNSVITTQLFFQFSAVVAFALLCSLVVALTLIPTLAARLPRLEGASAGRAASRLHAGYRRVLAWALQHRAAVYGAAALIFAVGMGSQALLGRETIPAADEGELFVSIALPTGTRLEVTDGVLAGLERVIEETVPEAEYVTVTGGSTAFGGGSHRGTLRVRLVGRGERSRTTEAIADDLRRRVQVPGGRVFVRASSGAFGFLRFGGADPVEVEIRGFDLRQGILLAQEVRDLLEGIPGITDANVAREEQLPEAVLRIDNERAAAFGLTPPQVAEAIQTAVAGGVATTLRAGGRETDIVVRQQEGRELRPAQVLSIPLITPAGRRVLVGQVAVLARGEAPTQIERRSRQRVIAVSAGISGRDFGSVMDDVRAALAALTVPEGFSLVLGQAYEEQLRAYRQLTWGFVLAVGLVFAVMAVQFEALLEPLLIMGSLPFALSGALLTLFLTGTTLNIQSLIGLIVLAGVVVNNAILLIQFILTLHRREGLTPQAAAIEGAATRLRPVLMTTATTIMGLLPVAIGIGEGAELQVPLARAVVGGLALGTLVTLVFIPTLYVTVEEFRERHATARAAGLALSRPAPVAGGENGEQAGSSRG